MPLPVSATVITQSRSWRAAATRIVPPAGVNMIAFSIRCASTSNTFGESKLAISGPATSLVSVSDAADAIGRKISTA
jgi:hypothetical protein